MNSFVSTAERALAFPTQATLNADIVTPAPLFARGSHAADFGLHLTGLTFTGPGYYDVRMDTNGQPYPTPHWTPARSHPALYVSGSRLRATLQLGAAAGLIGQVVHLRGEGGGYTLWCSNYTVSASPFPPAQAVATTALPTGTVNFLNPLVLAWTCAFTNAPDQFHRLGTTTNQVYVTWSPPTYTQMLLHTIVHLACSKTGGTNMGTVFENTWRNFASHGTPANVMTWDAKPLHYYKAGLAFSNATTSYATMLSDTNHNGQCGAWADLFGWALLANGRGSWNLVQINPPSDAHYLMIKEWTFGGTNNGDPYFQWEDQMTKNAEGNPEMVPLSGISGPVSPADGLAGQNSPTPAEKIFTRHVVVRNQLDQKYYDPSYGKVYTGAADFEDQVIAGYAKKNEEYTNPENVRIRIRKPEVGLELPGFPQ